MFIRNFKIITRKCKFCLKRYMGRFIYPVINGITLEVTNEDTEFLEYINTLQPRASKYSPHLKGFI